MAVQWGLLDPDMAAKIGGSFQQGQRNALAMQGAQQEQQFNALKIQQAQQQAQQEMANQNALSEAYRSSGGDMSKVQGSLMERGLYEPAMKIQSQLAEQKKADMLANKADVEDKIKKIELVSQILSSSHDQASHDANIQEIGSILGPELTKNIPAVYNPTELQFIIKKGESIKDQKYNELQQHNQELRQQEIKALGGYRQDMLAQGEERLGLQERQVGMQEQAAQKTTKGSAIASEDERKAAGWLSQADNAYKNMLKAMEAKPGSEQPGWREAALGTVGLEKAKKAVQTPERQQFTQAASSLSEAVLRAATGAGVNMDEARQKVEELTPSYLDDEATKRQKLDSIPVYLESLKTRAGRAAPEGYQVPTTGTTSDFSQPPKAGAVEDGHRFKGGDPSDEKNWEPL